MRFGAAARARKASEDVSDIDLESQVAQSPDVSERSFKIRVQRRLVERLQLRLNRVSSVYSSFLNPLRGLFAIGR